MRRIAVFTLGEIGVWQAVRPLIAVLRDKNVEVRRQAVGALGQIADQRAGMPLIDVLQDKDPGVRWRAIEGLRRIGVRAVEPLITALRDEDAEVRWRAIEVLGEIGDSKALTELLRVAKCDKSNSSSGRIADAAVEAVKKIYYRRKQRN